jgi:arylsulfatase A-like enzyme
MVLNIDLAATFADLAKIPAPEFVDGRSLRPLFGSNPPSIDNWRALVLVEQYPTTSQTRSTGTLEPSDPFDSQLNEPQPAYYGIRTMDRKYLHSNPEGNEELEFYDLQRDPYELQNIRGQIDPAILARYEAKAQKMHTCAGAGCRAEEAVPVH